MMRRPDAAPQNSALARLEASATQARAELASFYNEAALAAVAAALTLAPDQTAPDPADQSAGSSQGHNPALLRDDHLAA
jgi:hypothetical protein